MREVIVKADGVTETAIGVYVRVDTRVIKHFLENVQAREKIEVMVEFDGEIKKMTLAEFKELMFPTYKRSLQAILIDAKQSHDEVLKNIKKITIREGHQNYTLGPVMLGCHNLVWATLRKIKRVSYKLLKEVVR